jgi:hypothetical protein
MERVFRMNAALPIFSTIFRLVVSLVLLAAVIDYSTPDLNLMKVIKELVRVTGPAPQPRLRGSDGSITEAVGLKGEIFVYVTCFMFV